MKFIGNDCVVCKQKFKENDDIVVCDICGTPYHRECYEKVGKCINIEYHEKGLTFNELNKNSQDSNETDESPTNYSTLYKNTFAQYDRLIDSSSDILNKVNIDPQEEHLGVNFLEFYLYTKSLNNTQKFSQCFKTNRINSICTFLFPEYYLISKSMYVPAIFAYLTNFILSIPTVIMYLYGGTDGTMYSFVSSIGFKILTIISVVLAVLVRFNLSDRCLNLYFRKCTEKIRAIKYETKVCNKPYKECLYRLINSRSSFNLLAVVLLGVASNILYSNFYFILNLISMYFN